MAAELRMTGQGLQQDGGAGARQAADEDRLHDLSVRDVGRPHPRLEVGEPDPQARMARDEAPAEMHPGDDAKAVEAGVGGPGGGGGRRHLPRPYGTKTEQRRVGKELVRTCSSRGAPYNSN